MKHAIPSMSLILLSISAVSSGATTPDYVRPDNTRANSNASTTADQQKMNASDTDLSRRIRQALIEDKTLSTYAQNVKIITRNGVVTLAGPVRSEVEKEKVMEKASWVAGTAQIINNVDIAPN